MEIGMKTNKKGNLKKIEIQKRHNDARLVDYLLFFMIEYSLG